MYSKENNKIDIWPTEIPTIIHKKVYKTYLIRQYNIHIFNLKNLYFFFIYRIRQIKTIETKLLTLIQTVAWLKHITYKEKES